MQRQSSCDQHLPHTCGLSPLRAGRARRALEQGRGARPGSVYGPAPVVLPPPGAALRSGLRPLSPLQCTRLALHGLSSRRLLPRSLHPPPALPPAARRLCGARRRCWARSARACERSWPAWWSRCGVAGAGACLAAGGACRSPAPLLCLRRLVAPCPLQPLPFFPASSFPPQAYTEWDQAARRLLDARLIQAAVAGGVGSHPGTRLAVGAAPAAPLLLPAPRPAARPAASHSSPLTASAPLRLPPPLQRKPCARCWT